MGKYPAVLTSIVVAATCDPAFNVFILPSLQSGLGRERKHKHGVYHGTQFSSPVNFVMSVNNAESTKINNAETNEAVCVNMNNFQDS